MYKELGLEKDLEGFLINLSHEYKFVELKEGEMNEVLKNKVTPATEEFFSQFQPSIYNQERINEIKSRVLDGLPTYTKIQNELVDEYVRIRKETAKKGLIWYMGSAAVLTLLTGNVILGVVGGMLTSKVVRGQTQITPKMKQLALREKQMLEHWLR